MDIRVIHDNKKQFLNLLLLADEQENMIDRYLERGTLFALYEQDELQTVCVVTQETEDTYEIKNLATAPEAQHHGYGRRMIDFVCGYCQMQGGQTLLVGTGDSPLTIPFYQHCGFVESHRVPNFFTDHYDHPIFEAGRQLIDMVYLKRSL